MKDIRTDACSQPLVGQTDNYTDINLFVLFQYLAGSWRFILICVLAVEAITACSLRGATPSYQATMVVAPMEGETSSSQSLTSRVLSSLTAGASGGSQQFDEFQYKLTSPSVVRAANKDGKLYTWLYGSQWNPQTRTFQKPTGIGQFLRSLVRHFFKRPEWYAPNDVLAAEMLKQQILIESIPKSTLTRISYNNADPKIAVSVLGRLFAEADRELRNNQRTRLKAQIANANEVLAATQVSDYRMAMAQVLATSQYRLMNVPDNVDYSAHDVESPYVLPVPISPRPALTLTVMLVITVFVSAFVGVAYRIMQAEYAASGLSIPLMGRLAHIARRLFRR